MIGRCVDSLHLLPRSLPRSDRNPTSVAPVFAYPRAKPPHHRQSGRPLAVAVSGTPWSLPPVVPMNPVVQRHSISVCHKRSFVHAHGRGVRVRRTPWTGVRPSGHHLLRPPSTAPIQMPSQNELPHLRIGHCSARTAETLTAASIRRCKSATTTSMS